MPDWGSTCGTRRDLIPWRTLQQDMLDNFVGNTRHIRTPSNAPHFWSAAHDARPSPRNPVLPTLVHENVTVRDETQC